MNILPTMTIKDKIHALRDTEVMLDSDLAELYRVETKRINEAVRNNPDKFPEDFMFQCTEIEWESLRTKISTLDNFGRGQHRKYLPKAFTEQGVYMLATILKSTQATEVTISIIKLSATMHWNTLIYPNRFMKCAKRLLTINCGRKSGCLRLPIRLLCSKNRLMS